MRRVKQGVFIIFFFGLLVCIAAAPTFVTRYYNGRLMGSVTLRELPPEEDMQAATGIWDRLEIIENAKRDGTFYLDSYIDDDTQSSGRGQNAASEVLHMLEDQLNWLLADMAIEITDMELQYSEKKVYVDRERRDMPVGIWQAIAETPDYWIDAYMDEETGMIYDIMLIARNSQFSSSAPQRFREAGREYMNIEAEGGEGNDWLDVGVDYNDADMLRLYIYGSKTEDKDSLVTYSFYGFEEGWTDAAASVGRHIIVDVMDGAEISE